MRPPRRTDALSPLSFSGSRRHEGQRIARRREEDALGDRIPRCVSCHLAARAAASRRGIFLPRISLKRPRRASPRLGRVGSTDARRATRDARDGRGAARGADAAPSTDATASRRISARAARSTRAAVPRARRASRVRPLPFARSTSEAGQLSPRATSTFRGVRRRSFFFDRSIDRSIDPSRPVRLPPIRPRSRGERRSLRTFAVVSLRPGSLAFNPRPRRLSTPTDAFQLHPDIIARTERPSVSTDAGGDRRRPPAPPRAADRAAHGRPVDRALERVPRRRRRRGLAGRRGRRRF